MSVHIVSREGRRAGLHVAHPANGAHVVAGAAPDLADEGARVLFVGDFAASRLGNHSVAEDLATKLNDRGLRVISTSARRLRPVRVADMLLSTWQARRDIDVAVVDVFSGRAFLWAEGVCALLRRANVPYVLVLRGGNLPQFASQHERRLRRLLGSATAVVALSDYLAQRMGPFSDRIEVIPNPLDIGCYAYRERIVPRPRLIWLRTFHDIYNPTLAPRALAHLLEVVPGATLTMVGADSGDSSLSRTRRVAEDLGVLDRIEFAGPVAKRDVGTWLQKGDILINTPRIDNVPISVLEAMACGLCVVSTAVGGIPYLLRDGRDALLVPDDDARALANAVERCLHEDGLARDLSREGRHVAERFDWSAVLPRWQALIGEVAGDAPR